jgi:hypothetical protein
MKLFSWQPQGHGEQSFFVVAENEKEASDAVYKEIQRLLKLSSDDEYLGDEGFYSDSDFSGWGTDYYKLTIAEPGVVIRNDNS